MLIVESIDEISTNFTTIEVLPSQGYGSFAIGTFNEAKNKIELSMIDSNYNREAIGVVCYKAITCYDTSKPGPENVNPINFLSIQGDFLIEIP